MWLIFSSIFGVIFLGIGLLLRFKIRRDEKNGIFGNLSNNNNDEIIHDHFSEDDNEGFPISPFTGEYSVWEMSDEK